MIEGKDHTLPPNKIQKMRLPMHLTNGSITKSKMVEDMIQRRVPHWSNNLRSKDS